MFKTTKHFLLVDSGKTLGRNMGFVPILSGVAWDGVWSGDGMADAFGRINASAKGVY